MIQKIFKQSKNNIKLLSILGICFIVMTLFNVENSIGQTVSENNEKFLQAVLEGSIDIVREYLKNGIDVNTRGEQGMTALRYAAERGNLAMTRLLLNNNADVNALSTGGSALIWASYGGNVEVVELLIDKGADVNARGTVNRTALHLAAMSGKNEVIKKLLEAGNEVDAKDNRGETPLSMASVNYRANAETLLILIEHGADVNVKTLSRSTSLIDMLQFNEVIPREKIKVLIDHGLDINVKNSNGKTALMIMAEYGDVEKAKLLLEYGVDMDGIDEEFKIVLNNGYVIPTNYHGWWVSESLYNDYVGKVSPNLAQAKGQESFLRFSDSYKVYVTSLHEAWHQNIWVIEKDEIYIIEIGGADRLYAVKIEDPQSDARLILEKDNGEKFEFIKYPEKYTQTPPDEIINEIYIAGKYIINDASQQEVTFEVDGTLTGIDGYVEYSIGFAWMKFDWLHLITSNPSERGLYHWTFSGDTLSLFNVVEDSIGVSIIDTQYLQLIKISK